MSEFENVTITKEANVYFDGKVVSRSIAFADGSTKSLGVMQPGEYEFGTEKPEIMEIMQGELTVQLPGDDDWIAVKGGESFDVPGNARFKLKVTKLVDYCCTYVD